MVSHGLVWYRGVKVGKKATENYNVYSKSLFLRSTTGLRAFSVLFSRLWNSLPRLLRDTSHNTTSFGHSLKTFLKTFFSQSTNEWSALVALANMRYTILRFNYFLLTNLGHCLSQ